MKKGNINLGEIIDGCEKKYGAEFNGRLFIEQLISVDEAKEVKIEFIKEKPTRKIMKDFFEKEIRKIKIYFF